MTRTSTQPRGLAKLSTLTRLMVWGRVLPPTRTPAEVGLAYEDVRFPSSDGVSLRGWFIPAAGERRPVIVFVHGWLWNRTGNVAGRVPFHDVDVDFLPLTRALHDAGYHVLLFDLAGHGDSEARPPLTYGPHEARDFTGAVGYLRARDDVDPGRIGVVGTSAGGNTAIYGIPQCQPIRALLAVQPTRVPRFNRRFARTEMGPLGPLAARCVDVLYLAMRAPLPSRHDPGAVAPLLGETVVQYVQGTGDPWGEMAVVEEFSRRTPRSLGVIAHPSTGRYEGYRYITERADDVVAFFDAHV